MQAQARAGEYVRISSFSVSSVKVYYVMACVKLTTKAQLKLDANYSCTVSVILKKKIMLLVSPTSRWMVVQKRQITEN